MKRLLSAALVLCLLSAPCSLAFAADPSTSSTGLEHWLTRMQEAREALFQERAIVPPVPRKLRWRPGKVWTGEVPGQLVDVVAGDLNGDGKSEVYALTTEKIAVLTRARGLFDVRELYDLPQTPARMRSRDPIGAASIANVEGVPTLRIRTSDQEVGGSYQMKEGVLTLVAEWQGYPLCEQSALQAAPGRNFFLGTGRSWQGSDAPKLGSSLLSPSLYSARCSQHLVDPTGHPLQLLSEVDLAGTLRIQCVGDALICQSQARVVQPVGYAHLVTDVDNDGVPDVITSELSLPGQSDKVTVRTLGPEGERVLLRRDVDGGIVAFAVGDFDGDAGLGVMVAVQAGKKVSLWLLN